MKDILRYNAPINVKPHYHIYGLRVGESTINLPPGSGDLSLYILQLTNIQSLPLSFLTKCKHFIVGAIGGDLYFAKEQIPTFPDLSPYMW